MSNNIYLAGCKPEPLINYLKSLGTLRVIAKQKDPSVRGGWRNNTFYMATELNQEELQFFFINDYSPSPITAPWNGGSGFYGGTASSFIEQIEKSSSPRFQAYRETIKCCRDIIRKLQIKGKPNDKQKLEMLNTCRSVMPEDAVEVMDSLYIMTGNSEKGPMNWSRKFAPIFGSGGNDSRLEFTYTFLKYVLLVSPCSCKQAQGGKSKAWLEKALFDVGSPPLEKDAVGQYHPGGVGGPNSARGDKDISLVNPWDFILAFEGALFLNGAATRRFSQEKQIRTQASFPFSVSATAAGWGSLSTTEADDGNKNRGELWLPLWESPVAYKELQYVFSEGRAQVGKRTAVSGLDFARAVGGLGIDRGIYAFKRVGMMGGGRSGQNHLAVSLGDFLVQPRPEVNLINELDFWLTRFRRICTRTETPARYRRELRSVEEAIFDYCRYGGTLRMQNILMALGSASQAISLFALSKDGLNLKPIRIRSAARWLEATDDNSSEFRIAAALASITGDRDGSVGGIRENMEPVIWDNKKKEYSWTESNFNVSMSDLKRSLAETLEKRMVFGNKFGLEQLPINSKVSTSIFDVISYLSGELNERKIFALLKGMVLLDIHEMPRKIFEVSTPREIIPVYSLLKMLFLPHSFSWPKGTEPVNIRPELAVLPRLRGKDIPGAIRISLRRLKSSGLSPKINTSEAERLMVSSEAMNRLAGALLIPVYDWRKLADFSLIKPENIERS